uniref:Neurotransmitter-gated ion-channel ligand-binding domain-containing protein n=1 Tax=Vannella robusta TaxID=1487602 RepID=A0A7S4IAF3_9EUKA
MCTRIVLFVLCISQVCVHAGEISLPQKPIAVTIDFVDVRILNSRDAFFEAEFVFVYEWEDETVDQDTPLEEIIIPPIVPGNKVRNRKVYADKVIVLENSIQRIVRERAEWTFDFQLRRFPFDYQEPHIILQPGFNQNFAYVLIPTQTGDRRRELQQHSDDFHVVGWSNFKGAAVTQIEAEQLIGGTKIGVEFRFECDRNYNSFIVQDLVPSAIFVAIAWAGFWMDFTSLMPRLMPILIAVVALANLNSSTSDIVTRSNTSSFFEAYALFATIITALVLLELVMVHLLGKNKMREGALLLDKVSRFLFPSVFVITTVFLIIYLALESPLWASLLFL